MSSNPVLADLPLFPLHTVLFPGGLLPLKIFEARYLDMARECLREKTPFGVCLLKSGHEVASPGDPSVPETIGCLAEIAEVLERIIDTIREREPQNLPFVEPFLFDDPTWVSNRLAEILPIPMRARQKLMELMDAGARIDVVHHYMQHHQLL
jgi:Lon protease-like protein